MICSFPRSNPLLKITQILIADLTNERPNCYLEVGYALGHGKRLHLLLTARDDHHHDSPRHVKGGPKVHFDATGYGILFWDPNDLATFQRALEEKIRQRQRYISSTSSVSRSKTLVSRRPITTDARYAVAC